MLVLPVIAYPALAFGSARYYGFLAPSFLKVNSQLANNQGNQQYAQNFNQQNFNQGMNPMNQQQSYANGYQTYYNPTETGYSSQGQWGAPSQGQDPYQQMPENTHNPFL